MCGKCLERVSIQSSHFCFKGSLLLFLAKELPNFGNFFLLDFSTSSVTEVAVIVFLTIVFNCQDHAKQHNFLNLLNTSDVMDVGQGRGATSRMGCTIMVCAVLQCIKWLAFSANFYVITWRELEV
jgi:hypothetical protein